MRTFIDTASVLAFLFLLSFRLDLTFRQFVVISTGVTAIAYGIFGRAHNIQALIVLLTLLALDIFFEKKPDATR